MSENIIKIKSMTAFAKQQQDVQSFGLVACELKSVNSKFLDINIRISEQFNELEPQIRSRITSKITRGKIDCFITGLNNQDNLLQITDITSDNIQNSIQSYLELYKNIESKADQLKIKKQDLIITDVIELLLNTQVSHPKLLNKTLKLSEKLSGTGTELLINLLDDTLFKLDKEKSKEGERLKEALLALVDKVNACIDNLFRLIEKSESEQTIKFKKKIHKAISNFEISYNNDNCLEFYPGSDTDSSADSPADSQGKFQLEAQLESRVAQEIAIYLVKMDVSEELTRLKIHIDEAENLLHKGTVVGRKLDFLMQELTREANTLTAKSVNIEMRNIALDLKLTIEQMREQIQNIE